MMNTEFSKEFPDKKKKKQKNQKILFSELFCAPDTEKKTLGFS